MEKSKITKEEVVELLEEARDSYKKDISKVAKESYSSASKAKKFVDKALSDYDNYIDKLKKANAKKRP